MERSVGRSTQSQTISHLYPHSDFHIFESWSCMLVSRCEGTTGTKPPAAHGCSRHHESSILHSLDACPLSAVSSSSPLPHPPGSSDALCSPSAPSPATADDPLKRLVRALVGRIIQPGWRDAMANALVQHVAGAIGSCAHRRLQPLRRCIANRRVVRCGEAHLSEGHGLIHMRRAPAANLRVEVVDQALAAPRE